MYFLTYSELFVPDAYGVHCVGSKFNLKADFKLLFNYKVNHLFLLSKKSIKTLKEKD